MQERSLNCREIFETGDKSEILAGSLNRGELAGATRKQHDGGI